MLHRDSYKSNALSALHVGSLNSLRYTMARGSQSIPRTVHGEKESRILPDRLVLLTIIRDDHPCEDIYNR